MHKTWTWLIGIAAVLVADAAFVGFLPAYAHAPLIGIVTVTVALCDALFGQIIAQTQWIPFSSCHAPAEAQELVERFEVFHRHEFAQWMAAKISNGIAAAVAALLALSGGEKMSARASQFSAGVGYFFLGISFLCLASFLVTYFEARKASNNVRLEEMNYQYSKEHPELRTPLDDASIKRIQTTFGGYNNKPITLKPDKGTRQ